MKKNRMSLDKLTDHFGGDRTAAYVAIALFAIGLLCFIINSSILLASPETGYPVEIDEKPYQKMLRNGDFSENGVNP